MINKKNLKFFTQNNLLFLFSIIGYIIFSGIVISRRVPFFDEINGWNISQNCSFTELFDVSRREGHFILWYLLLKPLSLNNIGFEWSMYVLNLFFAFSAVLFMWKKAPFNPWLKMFITFSLPIQMFSVYARCYAIGVLLMFIICAIYPQRKKRPILYPFLIILLANTSIVAGIFAFVLGLLYCYEAIVDLITKKIVLKDLLKPFVVFSLGSIVILSQIINFTVPYYSISQEYLHFRFYKFFAFSSYWPKNVVIVLQAFLLLIGPLFFKNDKKPYILAVLSSLILLFIGYKVYVLDIWHYMFLFLFFVCTLWIYINENAIKTLWQKVYYAMFMVLSFMWIFYFKFPWHWNGFYKPTTAYLQANMEKYKGSKIFLFPTDASVIGIVPMLKNEDIEFYSSLGYSYKQCAAYVNQWNPQRVDFKSIKRELLSEPQRINNSYLFVSTAESWKNDLPYFMSLYEQNNGGIKIDLYDKTNDVTIYKISVAEKAKNAE